MQQKQVKKLRIELTLAHRALCRLIIIFSYLLQNVVQARAAEDVAAVCDHQMTLVVQNLLERLQTNTTSVLIEQLERSAFLVQVLYPVLQIKLRKTHFLRVGSGNP